MASLLALAVAVSSLAIAGCGGAEVAVASPGPRLVWIADGVWVLEDHPYAIYYHDGYYWRFMDGAWHRSDWYTDGFVRVRIAPRRVVRVFRPRAYIRYRRPRGVRTRPPRRPPRVHRPRKRR